jgi:hypothetical protein
VLAEDVDDSSGYSAMTCEAVRPGKWALPPLTGYILVHKWTIRHSCCEASVTSGRSGRDRPILQARPGRSPAASCRWPQTGADKPAMVARQAVEITIHPKCRAINRPMIYSSHQEMSIRFINVSVSLHDRTRPTSRTHYVRVFADSRLFRRIGSVGHERPDQRLGLIDTIIVCT